MDYKYVTCRPLRQKDIDENLRLQCQVQELITDRIKLLELLDSAKEEIAILTSQNREQRKKIVCMLEIIKNMGK